VKKETYFRNRNELDDSYDESDDYSGLGSSEPKQSPMRHKEKFRTKDFQAEKKHKDNRRNGRSKIKYDFES
jgi:hypothetical protein